MRISPLLASGAAAIALVAGLAGCSTQSDTASSSSPAATSTSSSADSTATFTGAFSGENGKKASGTVTIADGTITLAGFSSDQGPDLHLYLTNGTTEADVKSGVVIDAVAWDKKSQTFTVPAGVDVSKYSHLVEHCDKALAVFGAATLSK